MKNNIIIRDDELELLRNGVDFVAADLFFVSNGICPYCLSKCENSCDSCGFEDVAKLVGIDSENAYFLDDST